MSLTQRLPKDEADRLRSAFFKTHLGTAKQDLGHSHGKARSERNVAREFVKNYCAVVGLDEFNVQMSKSDQKHGQHGNRTFYWSKDLQCDFRFSTPSDKDMIVMNDVDYYVDMNMFLSWYNRPVMLFTVVPQTTAVNDADISYTFNKQNEICFTIGGGGHYQHRLWNYGHDTITTKLWFGFIPIRSTVYLVDRRTIGHHQMILLVPIGTWHAPWTWLLWLVSHNELTRLNVVFGEYTRLFVRLRERMIVSTGRVDEYCHIELPAEMDSAVGVVAKLIRNELTIPTVMTYLPKDAKREDAAVLVDYYRTRVGDRPDTVYPVSLAVRDYAFTPKKYDPSYKSGMQAFMSPVVHEAYVPMQCKVNDEQCIKARLEDVRSEHRASPADVKYMVEFAKLLVPDVDAHTISAAEVDEVYERQNRPTQRRLIEEGIWYGDNRESVRKVRAFQKAESYAEPKDPRNISTINCGDKVDYSMLIYACAEMLKRNAACSDGGWYAFGNTPIDIAGRVAEICLDAEEGLVKSDLSRFDGRVSYYFRELEEIVALRMLRQSEHERFVQLHNAQFDLRGRTKFDVKYETGPSRLSGSPETAFFNSIDNAFMVYRTFRNMGYDSASAYAKLGIYGGDDGLTSGGDNFLAAYIEHVASVGMKATAQVVKRNEPGVQFLARLYSPAVWHGSTDSMADLGRQMSKFHVTTGTTMDVTPEMKLLEKARGFYLSDRNTPVLGELATRAMWVSNGRFTNAHGDVFLTMAYNFEAQAEEEVYNFRERNYASQCKASEQYPNTYGEWMLDELHRALPDFDLDRFRNYLFNASTLTDLLSAPLCCEPKAIVSATPIATRTEVILPPEAPLPPVEEKPKPVRESHARKRAKAWKGKADKERTYPMTSYDRACAADERKKYKPKRSIDVKLGAPVFVKRE